MRPQKIHGYSLIEMVLAVGIISMLFMIAIPSMTSWVKYSQVKSVAESFASGLRKARSLALSTNQNVGFALVDNLSSSCSLSSTGTAWVISQNSPASLCANTASLNPSTSPFIYDKWQSTQAASQTTISANQITISGSNTVTGTGTAVTRVLFDRFGRGRDATGSSTGTIPNNKIEIKVSPKDESCDEAGCQYNIRISTSGTIFVCDPYLPNTGSNKVAGAC